MMKMNKKVVAVLSGLVLVASLAACMPQEQSYYYQDKLQRESAIEEQLEDLIEAENPELDFEVNLMEEYED
jgi:uncharacterized lipoprotein YehR (DUF1307 family)